MRIIVTCSCGGIVEKASMMYREQFGETPMPNQIYRGADVIRKLANSMPKDTNIYHWLDGIAKVRNRFVYSVDYDEKGNITELYDLQKKVRLA